MQFLSALTLFALLHEPVSAFKPINHYRHRHSKSRSSAGSSTPLDSTSSPSSTFTSSAGYNTTSTSFLLNSTTATIPATLCPANPTSLVTVTESVVLTHFITEHKHHHHTSSFASASIHSANTTSMVWPSSSASGSLVTASSISGVATSSTKNGTTVLSITLGSSTLIASIPSALSFPPSADSSSILPSSSAEAWNWWSSSEDSSSTSFFTILSSTTLTSTPKLSLPSSYISSSTIPSIAIVESGTAILVSATPATVATGSNLHPTTTIKATTTITTSLSTGTPDPEAVHCGLHGLPVGDYFLAEFVENRADEAVTLEGCYEFCAGIYGITMGCLSYDFYPEAGTGAPRCDLYGGSVAQSLGGVDVYVPNLWFDLACGVPVVVV